MHHGRTQLLGYICQKLASLLPGCLLSLHRCSQAAAQACKLRGGVVLHQLQAVLNTPLLCCLRKCTLRFGSKRCATRCLHVQLEAPRVGQAVLLWQSHSLSFYHPHLHQQAAAHSICVHLQTLRHALRFRRGGLPVSLPALA